MPIAIVLRNSVAVSLFKDAIIASLNSGAGDNAVMCSGFFQETFPAGAGYQATLEPGFVPALLASGVQLSTIGVYNGIWKAQYREFVENLDAAGVPVVPWYMPGYHWHAKVFVLLVGGQPLLGIIGSSNITSRAFGTAGPSFNYECDTILWDDGVAALHAGMTDTIRADRYQDQVIYAEYDPAQNFGITVRQRLEGLLDRIVASGIEPMA